VYTPWLSETLQIQPVSFQLWLELLLLAFVLLFSSEAQKLIRRILNQKIGSKRYLQYIGSNTTSLDPP